VLLEKQKIISFDKKKEQKDNVGPATTPKRLWIPTPLESNLDPSSHSLLFFSVVFFPSCLDNDLSRWR
jgi:hypothetical protein